MTLDLVIRNGKIIDGNGKPAYAGDVAVQDGVLVAVGGKAGPGKRTIDADGCIVTPGFVDIHTHYDAQVHWDPYLSPSSSHGVTSVVMGNCGVGFAPARPADREWLVGLMEGIEDISGDSLREGLPWDWETFSDFMTAVESRSLAIDVGLQIPHAPLRAYVMGQRGQDNAVATEAELTRMCELVRQARRAGALGLTGTRSALHRTSMGKHAPGYGVPFDEMVALARAAGEVSRRGAIGLNVNFDDIEGDVKWLRTLRRECGMPVWVLLNQHHDKPEKWKIVLEHFRVAAAQGEPLVAQVAGRAVCWLLGLTSSRNPFWRRPSYVAIAHLPLPQRVALLRDPALRSRLMAEKGQFETPLAERAASDFGNMFKLGDPPDYEPDPRDSLLAIAQREGREPQEVALDLMLEREGEELFYMPITNYASGDARASLEMLEHPCTVLGLGDGGAHVSRICDASVPTFMLTHWARDRHRGRRIPLERAVQMQTSETAAFFGLQDRGSLEVGKKADLNVIDFQGLKLRAPRVAYDQPAGGQRLVQAAEGYVATIVSGVPVMRSDRPTGDMPGRLIRAT